MQKVREVRITYAYAETIPCGYTCGTFKTFLGHTLALSSEFELNWLIGWIVTWRAKSSLTDHRPLSACPWRALKVIFRILNIFFLNRKPVKINKCSWSRTWSNSSLTDACPRYFWLLAMSVLFILNCKLVGPDNWTNIGTSLIFFIEEREPSQSSNNKD